MPKITVITPTFNSEKTLDGTIGALLRQTFNDFEYIIIDGLSKDNTLQKIKSHIPLFETKGVTVRIISEADKGVYDAMNKGIHLAEGELIGITNSDDWYEDDALQAVWNKFTEKDTSKSNSMVYGIERVWKIKYSMSSAVERPLFPKVYCPTLLFLWPRKFIKNMEHLIFLSKC